MAEISAGQDESKEITERSSQQPLKLCAGPLTMLFEPELAFVRRVRLGEREVVRGIYTAVRDHNWDTILPQVTDLQVEEAEQSFRVTFNVECRDGAVDFAWSGELTGEADGTLTYRMEGIARSTFLRNRIGFCVLHADALAGQPCCVEQVDGSFEGGRFPDAISPHQPFMEMRALSHEAAPGTWVEVRMEGDVFEMEDQRNWTDASYKTYCTPLGLPYPVEIAAGTRIQQSVIVQLTGTPPPVAQERNSPALAAGLLTPNPGGTRSGPLTPNDGGREAPVHLRRTVLADCESVDREVEVTLRDRAQIPLPRVGLQIAAGIHTSADTENLRTLNLAHLRVDLRLYESTYPHELDRALRLCCELGIGLEAAVFVTDMAEVELAALRHHLTGVSNVNFLIFHRDSKISGEPWLSLARSILPGRIGGGTDAYFAELNRNPPPAELLDLVCYSINPQVHAFDDTSLMETLSTQGTTVQNARRLYPGKPIAVTPITLKPRFNPNAGGPATSKTPKNVDPRQALPFSAAWALGSLMYLAASGAASVTYFETIGPFGVLDGGTVFPVYHALAAVGEFAGGEMLMLQSSDPLKVVGLILQKEGRRALLLANLTAETRQVTAAGLLESRNLMIPVGVTPMAVVAPIIGGTGASDNSRPIPASFVLTPYEFVSVHLEEP